MFREIFQYREMIFSLVKRDLRGRYKGSVLGFLWTFINPLLQLLVYTMVFSVIMRSGIEDYYMFLFVALVPWIFFSTSLTGGSSCIIAQQDMVKKIYFPREVLPIAHVTSQFINMLLSFIVIFAVLIIGRYPLRFRTLLCLPVVMVVEYILAMGITMVVAAITVYLRDVEYILGIFTMAWQFLTPVMYSVDMVPERLQNIFYLNPMTPIIVAYRKILYEGEVPQLSTLVSGTVMGIIILGIGWMLFHHLQKHFVEEL